MPLFWPLNFLSRSRDSHAAPRELLAQSPSTETEPLVTRKPSFLQRFFSRIGAVTTRRTTENGREPRQRAAENNIAENTPLVGRNDVVDNTNGTNGRTNRAGSIAHITGSTQRGRILASIEQPTTDGINGNTNRIVQTTHGVHNGSPGVLSETRRVPTDPASIRGNRPRFSASRSFQSTTRISDSHSSLGRAYSFLTMGSSRTSPNRSTVDDQSVLEQQLRHYEEAQDALAEALEDVEAAKQQRDSLATLAENRRAECEAIRMLYIVSEARVAELSTDYDILDNSYNHLIKKYRRKEWEQDEWEAEESDAVIREQVEVQGEQLRGVTVMLQGVEKMLEEWISPGLAVRHRDWYTSPDGSVFVVLLARIRQTLRDLAAGEDANWPRPACVSDGSEDEQQEQTVSGSFSESSLEDEST